MVREPVRAGPSSPPAQAIPIVLQYLSGDISSLLAAACVSHDWREAVTRMPEVWQSVHFPKRLAEKVTDQGLRWILHQSRERGVTRLDLGGCVQLTDQVVPDIVHALKSVPEKVSLKGCGRMTWRGARQILRHVQALYEQKGPRGANLETGGRCLQSVRLGGISLTGCDPAALACLTSLPVVGGLLDSMALCEECEAPRLLEKCEWCGERGCPEHDPAKGSCVRCEKFGCLEHFSELNFANCDCCVCDDCVEEHPQGGTACHMCDTAQCPVCDAEIRGTRECTGPCLPTNMICDPCRLEHCVCTCKDDGLTVRSLQRRNYPVLCEECVRMKETTPAIERQFGMEPAIRYCDDCGLLRRCHPDLGTDDDSDGVEGDMSDDSLNSEDTEELQGADDSDDYDSWFDDIKPRKKRREDSSDDESGSKSGVEIGGAGDQPGHDSEYGLSYDNEEEDGEDDEEDEEDDEEDDEDEEEAEDDDDDEGDE